MPIFPVQPERVSSLGLANTALALATPVPVAADRSTVLKAVYVSYSANVSVDVTVTLNSGAGAAYDVRLATITLAAQRWAVYVPDIDVPMALGDTIDVAAPAGGVGITATAQILLDHEYPVQDGEGGYQYEQVSRQ